MANRDHITRLKKGVATWNVWRDKKPYILSGPPRRETP
jgi:hypothetical protein